MTPYLKTTLAAAVAATFALSAHAVDAFDSTNNLLTLENVTAGGQTYRNVAVKLDGYQLLGVDGGAAQADAFDTTTSVLTLGSVALSGTTYNNVRAKINGYSLLNAGSSFTTGTLTNSNYLPSSEVGAFYATINQLRTECGLPALMQNTTLGTASASVGIGANKGIAGAQNLASNASYSQATTVGALLGTYTTNSTDRASVGKYIAQVAMTDPYAMLALARPYSEIGLTHYVVEVAGVQQRKIQAMTGNSQVIVPAGTVATLPCANTISIAPGTAKTFSYGVTYAAAPMNSSVSDAGFGPNTTNGTPIAVMANPGDALVINSATVSLNGQALSVVIADQNRSVNGVAPTGKALYSHEGFVYPTALLQINTTYTVSIVGTVNGVAFTKEFAFKTGAFIPTSLP